MASKNATFHEGVASGALLAPLKFAFSLSLALIGILLVAWTVDWILVFNVWPDGVERLSSILAADMGRGIDLAARQGALPDAVTATANFLHGVIFRATGIHDMGLRFADEAALSIPDTIVRNSYIANRDAIEVAMIGTQLLGVRLAILSLLMPLFVLIYVIAAADGLTQRAIRRVCGGRESASLYHRAKHLQVAAAAMAILVLLIWPSPVDWLLVAMPFAITVGVFARMQWSYYKKHL